jgi:GNAT superfamily N-acetyltransferase
MFKIRNAERDDVKTIVSFIQKLAEFEKLESEVVVTKELLLQNLFSEKPVAYSLMAFENETPVGFALYFFNFSTFLGKPGIYLEDLFILPEYRSRGYGEKVLKHLAQIAVEKDCGRLEWSVLDWNTRAIKFYESLGAKPQSEWTVFRVTDQNLIQLASQK